MELTHEDFQKARRISRAIQEYLEQINEDGLRSTDVYPFLAKKGLIEKDRHDGLHFRRFLRKLKENNYLSLIPQCQFNTTRTEFLEWYFYRVKSDSDFTVSTSINEPRKVKVPEMTEMEIDEIIKKEKSKINELPKRDKAYFTPQMLEIRENYPRAYERWTGKEIDIMRWAFEKSKRIDKVAELLGRQPSVVKRRLMDLNFLDQG
jgi:hypothetical protein